jgi:transglutaminase-like putative cysteine protease
VGFAPDVELGVLDGLLDDPTVVFRAEVEGPLPERAYWRGLALDGFDGRRWYSSTPPVPTTSEQGTGGVRVQVTPTGPSDGVLFVPGSVLHIDRRDVRGDPQGGWFVPPEASAEPYVVSVRPRGDGEPWFSESSPRTDRWLALPAMDARVSELATRVAGEGSANERAERLRDWLASNVRYTRSSGDHGPAPLTSFLLERREGHCEYVAAGLTVLLRSEGIPARIVNGFLGGDVDPLTGEVVVRRQHAHSWTEALLDGRWVLLDATPVQAGPVGAPATRQLAEAVDGFWQRSVVSYDRDVQRRRLARLATWLQGALARPLRAVGALLLVGLVGMSVAWGAGRLWRRRLPGAGRSAPTGLAGPLQRAEAAVRAAGLSPPGAAPPVELARWLRGRVPEGAADAFEALAWLHYDVVFGGVPAPRVRKRARELSEQVVRDLDPTSSVGGPTR